MESREANIRGLHRLCVSCLLGGWIGIDRRGGRGKGSRAVGVDRCGERKQNFRSHSDLANVWPSLLTQFAPSQKFYTMGHVKLVATTVKYMPQVVTNYRRQSTSGWSIEQTILDVIGGVFSITQLLIDCSLQNDWSGVVGNSTKLGLGNISLLFDSVSLYHRYLVWKFFDKN